jgi:hypothetical protein
MRRLSRRSLLRLTSRAELLANRALVIGAIVGACIGILGATISTWGSARIGSGLLVIAVVVLGFMFCAVAAAFLVGGYSRFRARAARGRTVIAYAGLAIALAGASFFVYAALAGLLAVLLRSGRD